MEVDHWTESGYHAAIDVKTNSFLLLLEDLGPAGSIASYFAAAGVDDQLLDRFRRVMTTVSDA